MEYVVCPHCGQPFRWDEIGTHDRCPNCDGEVNCRKNIVDGKGFQEAWDRFLED